MVKETIEFPVYRKYEGDRAYFKINSDKSFTEIQRMGTKLFLHEIQAKTYPDFQLIADMISLHNNHWIPSNELEFIEIHESFRSIDGQ